MADIATIALDDNGARAFLFWRNRAIWVRDEAGEELELTLTSPCDRSDAVHIIKQEYGDSDIWDLRWVNKSYYIQFLKSIASAKDTMELEAIVEDRYSIAIDDELAWGEEADKIEEEEPERARMLRAAEKRFFKLADAWG